MMVPNQDGFTDLRLPDERLESSLFWRIRRQTSRAIFRQLMTKSRLRTFLVILLSIFFWIALFGLFYAGFYFLVGKSPQGLTAYHDTTIRFVFHLFFASLNIMLVFSSGIILYGGLFSSTETRFLLTTTARPERIVLYKFQEAVAFSCWGFFLLASPLTIAYGIIVDAPWYYYVLIVPQIVSFVYIPCGIGAICCLLLIYRLASFRLTVVAILALVGIAMAGWSVWETVRAPHEQLFAPEWFNQTLRRFSFSQEEWLPSTWLCNSLFDAARSMPKDPLPFFQSPVAGSLTNLTLLVSNALMCHLVIKFIGKHCYRHGFSELECRPRQPRHANIAFVDRIADFILAPFPRQVQLLLIKDWRLLRRDPVQWSQFLIFFGLLGLYFLNLDRFSESANDSTHATWVNMVSFLNLAVVGLILSTFTTRFIYPLLSLEGSRFWVLGLMPIHRDTIVWSKFVFAAFGSWVPCALLVLLSDVMLKVNPEVVIIHQFTTILLCVGLAAMAVGLGATMPNFRESSPSKIAAGFGGTLNLVLSALYIFLIVILTALPSHFYCIARDSSLNTLAITTDQLWLWLVGGAILAGILGVLATVLPMRIGIRSFRELEFC